MKFCNCALGGTKACGKCAGNTGVSSEYYFPLDRNEFLKNTLEQERINRLELNKTEFEKFIDTLVEKVANSDEFRDKYYNNKLLWSIKEE